MKNDVLEQLKRNEGKYDGLTIKAGLEIFLLHINNNTESGNVDIEILRNDELEATIFDAYPQNIGTQSISSISDTFATVNEKIATAIMDVVNN